MPTRLFSLICDKNVLCTHTRAAIVSSSNYYTKSCQNLRQYVRSLECKDHETEMSYCEQKMAERTTRAISDKTDNLGNINKETLSINTRWRMSVDSNHRFWAQDILADYLNLGNPYFRENYWNRWKTEECGKWLPTILVSFMHRSSSDVKSYSLIDTSIFDIANTTLKSKGLSWRDVEEWNRILTATCADEMTIQLRESSFHIQPFVLLHILNQSLNSIKSLETLFLCTWDLILGKSCTKKYQQLQYHSVYCLKPDTVRFYKNIDRPITSKTKYLDHSTNYKKQQCQNAAYIDIFTFRDLAKRLLKHSRRLWPSSMINVAQLTTSFSYDYVARANCDAGSIDPILARQLSNLINVLMVEFSHLSSAEPYLLIVHNWSSQKELLKLAAKFKPALLLNQSSYRAIIQVFAAHKKTEDQRKSVLRRARTWPPWIVPQHGLDTEALGTGESTQVIGGVARLKEAGYSGDWFEDALRIIGGQEFDGTPTIQSRKMLSQPSLDNSHDLGEMEPNLWAARVVATRDIHEAWSAFLQFKKQGGQPNQEMYLAMFEKLTFESIRAGRNREYHIVPGDGLEVLAVPDNNYSEYFKRHLEPPSIEDLYTDMLRSGLKPHKRCLSFLVRYSRTPDEGLRYLRGSGLGTDALQSLGAFGSSSNQNLIMQIPLQIFSDYLYLLCRFVPRLKPISDQLVNNGKPTEWTILHLKTKSRFGAKIDQPLHLAAHLLNQRKPNIHQPWYSFFRAITREKSIISWEHAGQPMNDILAWKVLRASFDDFSSSGLHLNTRGFSLICHGLDKYIRAVYQTNEEDKTSVIEACHFIKDEFKKLSKTTSKMHSLPELYHSIRGVHLHVYMRCLALTKDYDEIITTLQWMTQNANVLQDTLNQESLKSQYRFRCIFITAAICCQGSYAELSARNLIESIDFWHGWPTEDEITEYRQRSPIGAEISF